MNRSNSLVPHVDGDEAALTELSRALGRSLSQAVRRELAPMAYIREEVVEVVEQAMRTRAHALGAVVWSRGLNEVLQALASSGKIPQDYADNFDASFLNTLARIVAVGDAALLEKLSQRLGGGGPGGGPGLLAGELGPYVLDGEYWEADG